MSIKSLLLKADKYNQAGRLKLALKTYNKVVKLSPSNITALNGAGAIELALGKYKESIVFFEKTLKLQKDNIVALGSIGLAYQKLIMPGKALHYYDIVLKLSPHNISAHINTAILLLDTGCRKEAIVHCDSVIKYNPAIAETYIIKGNSLSALGEFQLSIRQYQIALQLKPESVQSITGLVNCYIKLGDRQSAMALLKQHSGLNHPDLLIPLSQLADNNDRISILKKITSTLKNNQLSIEQKRQLCFSAGNLYDQIGDYDKAFDCYSSGNNLVNRSYNQEDDDSLIAQIIQLYKSVSEKSRQISTISSDLDGANLIFIIGMPRSGSSLIESMLGMHTDIFTMGERSEIPEIANNISRTKSYPESLLELNDKNIIDARIAYYEEVEQRSGKYRYITDKLPHNFLYLGLIKILFPKCKVIHCKRNKYDTCLSNFMQYYSSSLSYSYSLKNIANHYKNYEKIMGFWKSTGIEMYDVNYEDIVSKAENKLNDIFSFLNLDYQEECLKFYNSKTVTKTASVEQVTNPLYSSSINKWQNYQSHLTHIFNVLGYPVN